MSVRSGRARLVRAVAGPAVARRFALAHVIDDVGDSMVNLSLVGSLLLSVSVDASRSRVLLYLVLTAAPLAIAAPLVGPLLDRSRWGYRWIIAGSQALRGAVALGMVATRYSLLLYPLAFLVLASRKAYGLAKTGLLTRLTDDSQELLAVETHLARAGTMAGGVGTVAGGVLLARGSTTVLLLVAVVCFTGAALVAARLESATPALTGRAARLVEQIPAAYWPATAAVASLRLAAGALTYILAFAIKRGSGSEWVFAAGLLAAGAGGFVSTVVAARAHRYFDPDGVIVVGLVVPGVVALASVGSIGRGAVLATAFAIGLGNGLGTRSIAVLYARVPALARGRAIARSEVVFQVASVVGAGVAVQFVPSPSAGLSVVGGLVAVAGVLYLANQRTSLRAQLARHFAADSAPAVGAELPLALLGEAERLALLGAYRMAVVVAHSAVDVHVDRAPVSGAPMVSAEWQGLGDRVQEVRVRDDQPPEAFVVEVLAAARRVIVGDDEARRLPPAGTV